MEVKTEPCKNCGRDIVRYSEECWHCGAPTWLGILPAALLVALLGMIAVIGIAESSQHTVHPHTSVLATP